MVQEYNDITMAWILWSEGRGRGGRGGGKSNSEKYRIRIEMHYIHVKLSSNH